MSIASDKEPKARYTSEIQAMMYTFGDVRTPLPASAILIEQVVKKQLIDVIVGAAHVAHDIKSARALTVEDVIFYIRKDPVKVAKLREFSNWKELRKNAKAGDDTNNLLEGTEDDLTSIDGPITAALDDGGGSKSSTKTLKKRQATRPPWDWVSGLLAEVIKDDADLFDEKRDEEDPEVRIITTQRLRRADEMTREMSKEEYIEYSDCRQASFTYKKGKKFRDWLNPAQYIDFRLNDDVLEVLGFLAWDLVRLLTETALTIKKVSKDLEEGRGRIKSNYFTKSTEEEACILFSSPSEKTAITLEDLQATIKQLYRDNPNPARSIARGGHSRRLVISS